MDIEKIKLSLNKNRNELLDEYKEIKESPYLYIVRAPLWFLFLIFANNYSPFMAQHKIAGITGFFIYLFFEVMLRQQRLEKKMNILYEIEKIEKDNDNKNK